MSTMLPEEIFGGRRMEGNSIWRFVSLLTLSYTLSFK
jgi:hypothetical protein